MKANSEPEMKMRFIDRLLKFKYCDTLFQGLEATSYPWIEVIE